MSHVHAFPMHTYSLFNILVIFELLGTFLIVFLSLPLFLFTLVVSMAPKRKSTLARNLLHSGASSSSNSALLSLRFCDDDAHKAFSENFSRRGVHSERQVIFGELRQHWPSHCHSQSGMGVTMWRPDHLSSCAYPGVLLEHTQDWSFSNFLLYLRSRYAHSYHTAACYGCASSS